MVITAGLGYYWYYYKRTPEQPLAFSHKIHVEKVKLECNSCHIYADKSPEAGVPSVQSCMSCHNRVATDRPAIQKLTHYWEAKEPVPWIRVHSIPNRNYVYFSHKRHVKAGVNCSACHGEVKTMNAIRQVSSLKMGWCVTCHRSSHAPTDCLICHK